MARAPSSCNLANTSQSEAESLTSAERARILTLFDDEGLDPPEIVRRLWPDLWRGRATQERSRQVWAVLRQPAEWPWPRCESVMPDWKYRYKHRRWELTVGGWHAVVVRASLKDAWHTSIEHTSRAERHDGPDFEWPRNGRAWCEAEIARLAALAGSA